LQAHYRKQLNFSWEALDAAATGLKNLRKHVAAIDEMVVTDLAVIKNFQAALDDDMNTAEALAILQKALKEKTVDKKTVVELDKVLGLNLHNLDEAPIDIPHVVQSLLDERAKAREAKNWSESDRLRDAIAEAGFVVEDTSDGQIVSHL